MKSALSGKTEKLSLVDVTLKLAFEKSLTLLMEIEEFGVRE